MRRFGGVLAIVVVTGWLLSGAVALAAPGGQGQSPAAPEPNTPNPENPAGRVLGIVAPHGHPDNQAGPGGAGGSNLVYHRGPVMLTNTVYVIYWDPSGTMFGTSYQTTIDKFFQDVAADSGKNTNVYYSDTQYSGIRYQSTFGGSYWDTTPFPASGCADAYTPGLCLSDAQIQAEIQGAMARNGWTPGSTKVFFLLTPKGMGSCAGTYCAFSQYCAYHSWIGSGTSAILYANIPYADTVPAACDAGQHPNGNDADATINLISHEHNEAITDPQGNAWYDRRGYENGDKCAWRFGGMLGSTSFGQYNQLINGGHYFLQQEWSNRSSGCVLTGQ